MPEASGSSRQELLPAREAVVADLVRGVLAQWSQRVPWWRGAGDGGTTQEGCTMTLPALEQQVWRVEASAGRSHGSGSGQEMREDSRAAASMGAMLK